MVVREIVSEGDMAEDGALTPAIKRSLTKILDTDVQLEKGTSTVMNSLHRLASTFVTSLQVKENKLEFPVIKQAGRLF